MRKNNKIKDFFFSQRSFLSVVEKSVPTALVIDGKAIAADIRADIKKTVNEILASKPDAKPPGLGVIICGNRKDSITYVRLKRKAASEVGFNTIQIELPEDVSQADLEAQIHELNNSPDCHAFLIQLPLPPHIDQDAALSLITPNKDVDGLHPTNIGLLDCKGREPFFYPCTPLGVIEMLKRNNIQMSGKHAVVIGRSNIVGLPVAKLLLKHDATVTICHSKTFRPQDISKTADIIIAACGQAELVRKDWVKPGCAVIDVGVNPIDDATCRNGYRLVGDVHYKEVAEVAGYISPVPGGVGPMTVAMLMRNTLHAYKRIMCWRSI
eukprot:Tbor_TRINITY_DN5708_c1_g6::TRINITY_DN5708_c1_g6_i1::g.19971::m.19971